ncbi:cytochrome P450 [Rhizodiscina lignyota]|uniref:Cytochrome P450 n=1 Tax=Rhizodiscina lignyota TaxID=1504668 RepID=A0A9P4M3H4_9PEZI|nr:cytochrome P450 [Rhizodiscina lignyota]
MSPTVELVLGIGTLPRILLFVSSLAILKVIVKVIYNVFLHPLREFPGPLSHKISRLPYFYKHINGTLPFDMLDLHEKYGDIVRVAPDELAFSHPNAWTDIMGHQKSGKECSKAEWFYQPVESLPRHIVNEPREEHRRLRRQLAHGFSEKGMREQEPIIKRYVDLLVCKLYEHCQSNTDPIILSDWYNYCTFDIIGDLAFGESFGCLEGSNYHAWIASIFQSGRLGTLLQALSFVPRLKTVLMSLAPKSTRDAQQRHKELTTAKMLKRIEMGNERHDLIQGLLEKKDELHLEMDKLIANAEILIIGGSETTATLLSGVTYYILRNPHVFRKLAEEVRTSFDSEDAINLVSVGKLTYMLAVLNEGLRMYPPIANGLPRQIPQGGAQVLERAIPANTYVAIHQWALYRRESYFHKANEFHPERFLHDPEFAKDRDDALQPFHVGPRNCLGRNLAYSEMRLILTRVIYNFDMRLDESSMDWVKQRNYLMWRKGPLKVHLTPIHVDRD